MKLPTRAALGLLIALAACGESAEERANIVQAATKSAAEISHQIAEKTAELAQTTPEQAKAKFQEWVDFAARKLQEIKDSETAQKVLAEVQKALDKLAALGHELGEKLNLAGLKDSAAEMTERFKNDPRVVNAVDALKRKLESFGR